MEKTIPLAARCLIWLAVFTTMSHICYGQGKDITWLRSIHNDRNIQLDGTMHLVSQSSYPISAAIPAAELVYGFVKKDTQSIYNGLHTIGGLAVNTVIVYSLKYSTRRNRPYTDHPDIIPYEYDNGWSFPSGHTSFAFATATSLSIKYPRWWVIAPAYAWAGAVGYSRLHLGEHYPSDVGAGAAIGAGSAVLSYYGTRWLQQRIDKNKIPKETP